MAKELRTVDLTKQIKGLVLASHLDYVGIAPLDRFSQAPPGHRPTDLLPGARSVIAIGIRMARGALLVQQRALENPELRHIALGYRWAAYGLLNRHFLDPTALKVARLLEKEGYIAIPNVSSGADNTARIYESAASFSNKHAAVAAGLGEFGWLTLCLTPDAGPRVRFTSIITTAELCPDPMYSGPRLCDIDKCRQLGGGRGGIVEALKDVMDSIKSQETQRRRLHSFSRFIEAKRKAGENVPEELNAAYRVAQDEIRATTERVEELRTSIGRRLKTLPAPRRCPPRQGN